MAGLLASSEPCLGAPTITGEPPPTTTIAAGSQSPSNISVSASGTQPITYQWYRGSTLLPGQTGAYLYFGYSIQPGDAGSYTVQVTDPTGTATSSAAVVTVTPSVNPLTAFGTSTVNFNTFPGESSFSLGGYGQFNNGIYATQWYMNGAILPGESNGSQQSYLAGSAASGTYVQVLGNSTAQVASPPYVFLYNPPPPTNIWTSATAQGGVAYFAFNATQQILRYDMATSTWLAPVTLPAAPTAICALAEGVYVAEGRTTYLYSLDLSSSQALVNTTANPTQIFHNGTYVYLYYTSGVQSIDRSTLAPAATTSTPFFNGALAIAATSGFAYGWSESEGSVLTPATLNPDGSISGWNENFNISQEDTTNAATVITPDGNSFIAGTGNIYSQGATPAYEGSLGLPITDGCFFSDGSLAALRTGQVTLYGSSFAEEGIVLLPGDAQRIFANGSTAFAFSASATLGGQPTVASVTEAQLVASPRPTAAALSASASSALGVMPDDGFVGTDGNLYLLSRVTGNILRWSPSSNGYLASIPLSGVPIQMTYSSTLNRIYLVYGDQRVTQVNLGSGTAETNFTVLGANPGPALAVDGQFMAQTNQIYTDLMFLFSSSGAAEVTESSGGYQNPFYWDSANQSMLTAQFNSLLVYPVGASSLPASQSYDSSVSPEVTGPLRISADGSLFADANGVVYNTTSYARVGVLPSSPIDVAWSGTTVIMISSVNGATQLDMCPGPNYLSTAHASLAGAPFRIWAVGGGNFAVLVGTANGPEIYTINSSLGVVHSQSNSGTAIGPPLITTEPIGAQVTAGSSATFNVAAQGANPTYSWTYEYNPSQVLSTSTSLTLSNITASMAGVYYVTVTSNGISVESDSIFLLVDSPPTINYGPYGLSVAQGQSFTLTAQASGQPLPTYQWYLNGTAISGATSSSYTIASATSANAGTYTVEATNSNGTTTSQPAVVTVTVPPQAPSISTQPASQSVDSGALVTFSVQASGTPAPTYQWYFDSSPISGATSSSYKINSAQPSNAGSYAVEVSNQAGNVMSSTATLSVSLIAVPSFATQPLSQTVALATPVTFTVSATGTGPLSFQWSFDNTPITGATSSSYSITAAQVSNSGSYTVAVTGPDTTVVSQAALLTVSAASGSPVIAGQPQPQTIESGSTVTFNVSSTGTVSTSLASRAAQTTTYQWLLNDVAITGATNSTLVIKGATAANSGSYSCLVSNASGAVVSSSAVLSVVTSSDPGRMIDISCRAEVGTGGGILISGFTIGGNASASLPVLVRSSGPALTQFNVTGVLADPLLKLFAAGASSPLETNDGWAGDGIITTTAAAVGAFAWTSTSSHDSAIVQSLNAGGYTAQTLGESGDTGVALSEVYDATPAGGYVPGSSARLTNISTRVNVGTGASVLIAGFVIGGQTSETVLIRASGPALSQFGVTGILPDPELTLNGGASSSNVIASSQGWSGNAQAASIAASVGAFAWPTTSSNDSLLLVTLAPGAYTATVAGAAGDTGVALIEVYEVP